MQILNSSIKNQAVGSQISTILCKNVDLNHKIAQPYKGVSPRIVVYRWAAKLPSIYRVYCAVIGKCNLEKGS